MGRSSNRLDHVIWIVRPENIERYVQEAERLFGVEFERLSDPAAPGAAKDIFISFDGGLEFIAPLAPTDTMAKKFQEFLDEHGEGLYGLVFGVDSLEDRISDARELGFPATDLLQSPDAHVRRNFLRSYTTRLIDAKEAYVGPFVGTSVVYGEFVYPEDEPNQAQGA
ncbi:MAG: VOC family protein [Acidimicrobiia bacterium]